MRAAAVQLNSTGDVDRNLEAADRLTRAAAKDGAQLVVLPEKWPALGPPEVVARGADRAADVDAWAAATAAELEIDLVAGSYAVRGADGRLRNTAHHVRPTARPPGATRRSTSSTSTSRGARTASPTPRTRATGRC
jgi:predicted amidohydrolase